MSTHGWLRTRLSSIAATTHRRDRGRRRRLAILGSGPPRLEGLEDRTLLTSLPVVATLAASNVSATGATLNGTVNPESNTINTVTFQYATNPYLAPSVASTFAGSGTGTATISNAQGVAVDPSTGDVFVADTAQDTILMITPSGTVSTIAGTPGTPGNGNGAGNGSGGTGNAATFNGPTAIAFDPANGDLFVADTGNNVIRMLTPNTSGGGVMPYTVSTLAGTGASGSGASASFSGPTGIAVDPGQGTAGTVYVADTGNNVVDAIDLSSGTVTPLAGTGASGSGASASFSGPTGIAVDPGTHNIYVADTGHNVVDMITATGTTSPVAGTSGTSGTADGAGSSAQFNAPKGLAFDPTSGLVYVADSGNHSIRLISSAASGASGSTVSTLSVTNSSGSAATFTNPVGLAVNSAMNNVYVADSGGNTIQQLSAMTATASPMPTAAGGVQSISATASNLSPSTTYYYRAMATTSASTTPAVGSIVSFTTTAATTTTAPTATTQAATDITGTTATLNATVNPQGGDTSAYFIYGTDSTLKTNTTKVPVAGLSLGTGTTDQAVKEPVSGLSPSTTYYYEVVAANAAGTTTGNILSFTTTAQSVSQPVITSVPASNVTTTTATAAASVNPNGAATTVSFVYGTTPTLTSNTQTTAAQAIGSGTTAVPVTASLTNLQPGMTYYYQAVATSNGVSTPGPIASFTTAKVTTVNRYGYHNQPTAYVLHFNQAVNPAWARDVANYRMFAIGGGRHHGVAQVARGGAPIVFTSAVYDAANHTVRLRTARRVYLYGTYELVVNGGSPTSVGGSSGVHAQAAGLAGANDPIIIRESDLAGPNFRASMTSRTRAQIMRAWPHDRAFAAGVMRRIDAARAAAAFRTAHRGPAAVMAHRSTAGLAQPAQTSATAQAGAQSATVDAAISSLVVAAKAGHHKA